jgi:RNA recognition motif-containing protein
MAVVIRLQGLRITAGSEDIRNFFTGLKIPDGGVHIIGGENEEAFIVFASDEDARRAMIRSGGCIKGSPVNLLLSSKSEMQSLLEESTKNAELDQKRPLKEDSRRLHGDVPVGPRRTNHPDAGRSSGGRAGHSVTRYRRTASPSNDDLYVFLKGMPFSVTESDVRQFFDGLLVDGIILMKNGRGQNNGLGLVKFATRQDARDGIKRDRGYIGSRFVEVYLATEQQWHELGGVGGYSGLL